MPMQFSTTLRNNRLSQIATLLASGSIAVRTGAPPANAAAANSGTLLASVPLGASPFNTPSGGSMSLAATVSDTSIDASGYPGHYRAYAADGTTCHVQGIAAITWKASANFPAGAHCINDSNKVYRCTTGGVSASSGGPTGTGGTITDGSAVWAFVQDGLDGVLALEADLTFGQTLNITGFAITDGNA